MAVTADCSGCGKPTRTDAQFSGRLAARAHVLAALGTKDPVCNVCFAERFVAHLHGTGGDQRAGCSVCAAEIHPGEHWHDLGVEGRVCSSCYGSFTSPRCIPDPEPMRSGSRVFFGVLAVALVIVAALVVRVALKGWRP